MRERQTDIERALVSLAERVEFPPMPDLASAVGGRLAAGDVPQRPVAVPARPIHRSFVAVAASVVLMALLALTFSPATREAVADWIGLDGVRITYGPRPQRAPVATSLRLGDLVSLERAGERVDIPVRVPAALGLPDEVYVDGEGAGANLSLVYRARDDLPSADETGVGALITQFRADLDRALLEKVAFAGTVVEELEVAGGAGYWLSGGPHLLHYLDAQGVVRQLRTRLAGNTLLWEADGVLYRLEADISRARAVVIADSMF